jgi:hypothetical protein
MVVYGLAGLLWSGLLQLEEYGRVCDVLMSTYARPKFDPLRTLESTLHIPVALLKVAHVLRTAASPHAPDFLLRLLRLAVQVLFMAAPVCGKLQAAVSDAVSHRSRALHSLPPPTHTHTCTPSPSQSPGCPVVVAESSPLGWPLALCF